MHIKTLFPLAESRNLVCIALGTNMGDRAAALDSAIGFLKTLAADSLVIESTRIETEPVDCPPGSQNFLNSVALFQLTKDWSPQNLLSKLHAFEKQAGRLERRLRNAPRPIDLDIIFFACQVVDEPDLQLPHPRAAKRSFVLGPLSELMPELILPGQKRTVSELLKILSHPVN